MKNNKMVAKDINTLKDQYIGKRGTAEREKYEYDLTMDILGAMIREARIRKKMSQEQLGALIGVQKAQVSKIENHTKSSRIDTIIRILNALDIKVKLSVEFDDTNKLVLA